MSYSDRDLRAATQVAYMDFNQSAVEMHPDWTIKQHLEHSPKLADEWNSKDPDLYNEIMNGRYSSWKLINYENKNGQNGFVGCFIDTGDGNAIVGFRGSESRTDTGALDYEQIYHDWIASDVGLMNSTDTPQQREARDYLDRMYKEHGTDYNSFSVTGHSLGGNLAEDAVLNASDECYAKIDRTLNLDGPGFSDEYTLVHRKEIEKHAGKIDHYQYSLVGAILNPIAGTNYQNMLASEGDGLLQKHDTKHIVYDSNGNMIVTEPDELSVYIHGFTNGMDDGTFAPGILSISQILMIITNPALNFLYGLNRDRYMERYKKEAQQRYQSAHKAAEFKVQTDALVSAAELINSYGNQLDELAEEVNTVKNNVSLLIKLSAIFTVACKMNNIRNSLNKCSKAAANMSNKTEQMASLYTQFENEIMGI